MRPMRWELVSSAWEKMPNMPKMTVRPEPRPTGRREDEQRPTGRREDEQRRRAEAEGRGLGGRERSRSDMVTVIVQWGRMPG